MEGKIHIEEKSVMIMLMLIFSVGIIGHTISSTRDIMLFLTPFTLSVTCIAVFFTFFNRVNRNLYYWFVLTFVLTFLLEAVGVKTGMIFGSYSYGNVLGPKVLEVPLLIGINWALIILGTTIMSSRLTKNRVLLPLFAGLFAVAFDVILEPVATGLKYWNWEGGNIPLQNYLAWFLIGTFSAVLFTLMKVRIHDNVPEYYFLMQFIFFVALFLTL